MKITTLMLFIVFMQVSAKTIAQKVTLSEKNAPLTGVLTKIKKQTGYDFVLTSQLVEQAQPVTISVKNVELKDVLDEIFQGQPLNYQIEDKSVTISIKQPTILDKIKTALNVPVNISGKVTDSLGTPLIGATVADKTINKSNITDEKGEFSFNAQTGDIINVSFVGYHAYSFTATNNLSFQNIVLYASSNKLSEVVVSTGYQTLPKERATGSFDFIDNSLLNRSVSTDILSRLDGVSSGVIFNKNLSTFTGQSAITIRGRSTIYGNASPLVVVDNFPYDGDVSNINPNNVESVTILKDAAAASIWGVRSGNGVIVITTKRGKFNQKAKISLNTNITVGDKPNLFYGNQQMSTSDYIDVETYLFNNGYYNNTINGAAHLVIPPVVEILNNAKNGQISQSDASNQINALRNIDNRNDLTKYFYQKSLNQQYDLNISGGGEDNSYFVSGGFDKNLQSLRYNDYNRITLTANNTYTFFNKHLEVGVGLAFTRSKTDNNNSGSGSIYPYEQLVNANGNALQVPNTYRESYINSLTGGTLLNWAYRPYDEIRLADNPTITTDYQLQLNAKYRIIPGLDVSVFYQYGNGLSNNENYRSLQTYYTRNLINLFTNPTGTPVNPVPIGGILDVTNNSYQTNNLRGIISYNKALNTKNEFSLIAGSEYKSDTTQSRYYRLYGYDPSLQSSTPIDNVNAYKTYITGSKVLISNNPYSNAATTDHYLSYFANGSYTYNQKYIISASGRIDQSNLFGVTTNLKTVPLWSVGGSWIISKEPFYNVNLLPFLKVRITDGYNGNIDKSLSAFTTAQATFYNVYGSLVDNIVNPPNPSLRWERVSIFNAAVDFGSKNNTISGSLEWYNKSGKDLIGNSTINPSSGIISYTGNTASNNTKGIDVTLNLLSINHKDFKWSSNLLFNYAKDKVTKYNLPLNYIGQYLGLNSINPMVGKPLYSVYAYPYMGLDGAGNPQGLLDGKVSELYSNIQTSTNFSNLKYIGPATPPVFGSLRNTFAYHELSLSFNIKYEFGFYFRRNSLNYSDLFSGIAHEPDYDLRWQKPGDELNTNVPSMIYPDNSSRDQFYQNSTALIEKGDNIRVQDIQLAYELNLTNRKSPFKKVRFYTYINNIGIIWRANKKNIDPDYYNPQQYFPIPRTYAIGSNFDF